MLCQPSNQYRIARDHNFMAQARVDRQQPDDGGQSDQHVIVGRAVV